MAFYAARQPILDAQKQLFGYELLFRSGLDNIFPKIDEEKATSKMLDGLYFDMGLDKVAEGKTAFINFTKQSLLDGLPTLLPNHLVTVEVLESVQPTPEIYEKVNELYEAGYTLALDDFIHHPDWEPFYKLCKVIKVDCMDVTNEQINDIIQVSIRHPHIRLLAEKVEDIETFNKFKNFGFTLFQGYFFAKPEVIKSVSFSASQSSVSALLAEVSKTDLNVANVVRLFETDAALSFRLLKYVQSPIFQRRNKVESIKQAVILLGHAELKRFITLLFAATFSSNKPSELIKLSLQRAKLCELLSNRIVKMKASSSFLLGMMSLLDAMLDTDLETVLESLPLTDEIKLALIKHIGVLADLLHVCESLEKAQWATVNQLSEKISIPMSDICSALQEASEWADNRIELLS